ncbi:uncharacterized protein LOC141677644 [Apium graveolens]|uniref:uncharacterized protein LOC141677644 n=1 Tax=Apium graveolens TaxID=4045 RepID=UPI003D7BE693
MEIEQEQAQNLDIFGIIKESINVVVSWKTIFGQITLLHILPLSVIFLSHIWISEWLFGEILYDEDLLLFTREGSPTYNDIVDLIHTEKMLFIVFTILYYIFVIIFSLISTSAVVYTIACIYTEKDLTFKKLMRVVPRVWQRLMVTFMWSSFIVFAYNIASCFVLVFAINMDLITDGLGLVIFLVTYLIGFAYIGIVWQLACVISVLEDISGIQAISKSKDLIQGKTMVAGTIYILVNSSFAGIQLETILLGPDPMQQWGNISAYGMLCVALVVLILFGLVSQTIIYFVCKSYHCEIIDKPSLADHLEEFTGGYMPLLDRDVQLGKIPA